MAIPCGVCSSPVMSRKRLTAETQSKNRSLGVYSLAPAGLVAELHLLATIVGEAILLQPPAVD